MAEGGLYPNGANPPSTSAESSLLTFNPVVDMNELGLLLQQPQQQMQVESSSLFQLTDFSVPASSANKSGFSSSASSVQNSATDDEDFPLESDVTNYRERRREAHTEAERKRRESIKKGYDELTAVIPTCQEQGQPNPKLSKAAILQKSIDYLQYLQNLKRRQEDEIDSKRRELMALTIMRANYEHILSAQQGREADELQQVPDEVKFRVFQQIMDRLFESFNSNISTTSFAELSGGVISWLEEHCKPQALRDLTVAVLRQVTADHERVRNQQPMQ